MSLTKEQAVAYECIIDDLVKDHKKAVLLAGYAGSGKTFLLNRIIETLDNRFKICVSAPTHKALTVLKTEMTNIKENVSFFTLAALLGMRPDVSIEEYDPFNPIFAPIAAPRITAFTLIVMDECSMIPTALVKKLLSYNIQIIFAGDPAQLPPVKEKISALFESKIQKYILKEIVRTKHSDIMDLSYRLRSSADIDFTKVASENIIVVSSDEYKFEAEKILAYTNQAVKDWNILHRNTTEFMRINEKLMFYTSLTERVKGEDVEYFYNSEEVEVSYIEDNSISPTITVYFKDRKRSVKIVKPEYYSWFAKHYKENLSKAKETRVWKDYFGFVKNNLIMETINAGTYTAPKQIDYGYACTIHKSQGSTYASVAVDINNVRGEDTRALLYVACTRAKEKLYLII